MDIVLSYLTADFLGKAAWIWLMFIGIVVSLLAFDLGCLHKGDHEIGVRESPCCCRVATSAWRCHRADLQFLRHPAATPQAHERRLARGA